MACEKCEKKLAKVIVPNKWKEGAHKTTEGCGRNINENELLSKKHRWTPYGQAKYIICKHQVHQDAKYCHTCAYSKECVQCAASKCLTPSSTSKAMCDAFDSLKFVRSSLQSCNLQSVSKAYCNENSDDDDVL